LADDSSALDSLNEAVAQTHLRGSSLWASAYTLRGCGWLWHGQLNEAQGDINESLRMGDLTNSDVGRVFAYGFLAEILLEQGQMEASEEALGAIGITTTACPPGPFYVALTALSRLARERGDMQVALDTALHARQLCQTYDIHNTAYIGWRTEAAMALHALGRNTEARQIAAEDLTLARRWGAPRALGRALRISGILTETEQKISLLEQTVSTLENSPARLEQAKALADYGITLRQSGRRTEARTPLRQALELAEQCGAHPLAQTARSELTAAGGRTRRTALAGPNALTPSEHRIATLAATGATNRQIAQQLYVTPKTVEVHLSATYRKLGITSRTQLAPTLNSRAAHR
ncbi:LuxR C-terminal-related transcriptional regulator, partial [Streptomyces sp. NPDC060085]|uniref:helix-turn-helix transcriptional regulator n=1 Tax=Streptomyces sp. NPDC060085 TaxID=3347054 RepID=UPI00364CC0E8